MVFRLREPLDTGKEERNSYYLNDDDDGIVDENLKWYFMEYEKDAEQTAEQKARSISGGLDTVEIDVANMLTDISDYNEKMLLEYGFVTELRYKGQHLTKRLCPKCHNEVVPGAGLYDMKLIALYGDTNAGKTVFLNILEAMLKGDPRLGEYTGAFHGIMSFQGTDEEKNQHMMHYERLIKDKELYEATAAGTRVPPQAFRFSYRTADHAGTDKNLLIVFCDIPGEDTRQISQLRKSGYYLKNVDGILTLLDTTRLINVAPYLRGTVDGEGEVALNAEDALTNLSTYLSSEFQGAKIKIPTAVVATKLDVLKSIASVSNDKNFQEIIYRPDANNIHKKYLDKKTISDMNIAVKDVLVKLGGRLFCDTVGHCFSDFNYFAVSALGKSPKTREVQDGYGQTVKTKYIDGILEPYRVTEPFYWILSKCDCIPYRYTEVWKSTKGDTKTIELYYYESERNGAVQQRYQEVKEKNGIVNHFFGKRWNCVERMNGF
jgi:hypothetical protein